MDTPKNIVYLLGAGASANCLPCIDGLPERFDRFISIIQNSINFASAENSPLKPEGFVKENAEKLKEDVKWLKVEMQSHKTVDTLAKKFYLIKERHDDLIKLKRVLTSYFIFEQVMATHEMAGREKELPDKRYDSFIATIINNKRGDLSLSNTFKIISWNYDIQFELSYQQYRPDYSIAGIQHCLQIVPTKTYATGSHSLDFSKFCLIRLNGVAGLNSFEEVRNKIPKGSAGNERQTAGISAIANSYVYASSEEFEYLNYSWENKDDYQYIYRRKEPLVTEASRLMKQAEILVIIGYSFPIFNRGIDRQVFDDCPNLKKIYVQDKNADAVAKLISNSIATFDSDFRSMIYDSTQWDIEIIPVTSVDQFFIPPESDI